jgi:hypothetical protein
MDRKIRKKNQKICKPRSKNLFFDKCGNIEFIEYKLRGNFMRI